ncbi:hypothetical protein COEREDRAFT_78846 [Coemansia reversa NRRL 1564]|uniref:Uncharacterized protein n=1 Tax=Coemansia reversa (strain ATCC 12441 / NRRL 1564) TaxID=763665 RepID=A0A2G5BKG7_COERN|nr:hypothetical protein COEREDRAFT_78846 [Coemansia reversa NRRL 1564]|eukprot:PIA19500.1 hypothetical protein COEREDRAFT_78846 [Coemansia reversa NRRL 1564]
MKLTVSTVLICAGLAIRPAYAQNINAIDEAPVSGGGSLGNNNIGDAIVITNTNLAAAEPTTAAVAETAAPAFSQETNQNADNSSINVVNNAPDVSIPAAPSASVDNPVDVVVSKPATENEQPTVASENTLVANEPISSPVAEQTPTNDVADAPVVSSNEPNEQGTHSIGEESGETFEDTHSTKHSLGNDDEEGSLDSDDKSKESGESSQESDKDSQESENESQSDDNSDELDDSTDLEDGEETDDDNTGSGMRAYAIPYGGISTLVSAVIISTLF